MEDFDIFTDEINFSKPLYNNILSKFVKDIPFTPNGANYQNGKRLLAEECLTENDDVGCAFNLSEAVSASLRALALYRNEQLKSTQDDKVQKVNGTKQSLKKLFGSELCKDKSSPDIFTSLLNVLEDSSNNNKNGLAIEKEPLHKHYLKFTADNNVVNFRKILQELPREWTVIQLCAPFNPDECLKPQEEYRSDIKAVYMSVLTNEYLDDSELGPFNIVIPAYETKVGERPLFTELYSLLDENYRTIENAQALNNKRLVQNYWNRREDIDLRMKSVIMIMDREWLGGWNSLLTGKLVDKTFKNKIKKLVDDAIKDWGFVHLTLKQRILLYNIIESSSNLSSTQIKSGIRRILTEHGNPDDLRQVLDVKNCDTCTTEFNLPLDLCLKCLSKCFKSIHNFTLVEGIKAFSDLAIQIREHEEWATLKKAKRYPVILIVDEILDTFPWESLPILNTHPVSRMENIHFLYYLYKVHEKHFENGYFMVNSEKGRYIINPEKNLERMEKRMGSFIQYWCPDWRGVIGAPPAPEDYEGILKEADMFLYCGHGDGLQLGSNAHASSALAGATALLAGCGSARLPPAPPRAPRLASHHHYHTHHSPLVVGMLWEVTDLEVDKVVSALVSLAVPSPAPLPWPQVNKERPLVVGMLWEVTDLEVDKVVSALVSLAVPSPAPLPWPQVNKERWAKGIIDVTQPATQQSSPTPVQEHDLLSAASMARRSTHYVMIAASVVARGLPLRIRAT